MRFVPETGPNPTDKRIESDMEQIWMQSREGVDPRYTSRSNEALLKASARHHSPL